MRRVSAALVLLGSLVAACAPTLHREPAAAAVPVVPPVPSVASVPAPSAHDVFDALCKKMEASKVAIADPPPRTEKDDVELPSYPGVLAKVTPALPARLRKASSLLVSRVAEVERGRLVEVVAEDPTSPSPSGTSSFLVFLPARGAPKQVEGGIVEIADFDGDAVFEPVTAACKDDALYGRDCTFTAWFAAATVSWSAHLHGDRAYVVGWAEGKRSIDIVPADANDGELAVPSDVVRVLFAPRGVTTRDGSALFARDEAFARRTYALEICASPASLDPASRRAHLAALGASAAEIEAILTSADGPLPPFVASPEPTAATDTFVDPAAAVWSALPKPSAAPCRAPAQPIEDVRAELVARAVESARARFVDLDGPVVVRVGCTSHGETPVVVTRSERHEEANVDHRELYLVTKDRTVKIAATRSRWRGEWHHVKSVRLGPAGDFDGDGERETLVEGDDLEGGAVESVTVTAYVRGGAIVALGADASAIVPLGPSRDGVLAGAGKVDERAPFPWPPRVLALRGSRFVPVPVPGPFTEATRAARATFPKR